ncbi:hypothetical protein F5878DRAFT_621613 [Lentinula raphanica]|uniref:Uncharacterized protein n=1 Tax=Lentinula raphanica TaxID=153919 RepID=A0AA38P7H7_9AGAR|nr:hypothetical protein F5878DRAFT_621613 [Lentinula raphanica]
METTFVSLLDLPEELLQLITVHASLRSRPVNHYHEVIPEILQFFLPPTAAIQSLSLVCRTLRQISLPFLLASVRINRSRTSLRLGEESMANAQFSGSVRALVICEVPDEEQDHLRMQIARISFVHAPSFFQEHLMSFDWDRFDWKPFNGIRELSLKMGYHPAALPWLPRFVSAHCPGLQKIEFVDKMDTYFSQRDEPVNPFVVCFNEEVDQEQSKGMDMLAFNMRRVCVKPLSDLNFRLRNSIHPDLETWRPIYEYPEQWDVSDDSDLDLFVRSSLHQLLAIIGTCYRNIVVLDLEFGDDTSTYDVDEFISSLRNIPSLRQLGLFNLYDHLCYAVTWRVHFKQEMACSSSD